MKSYPLMPPCEQRKLPAAAAFDIFQHHHRKGDYLTSAGIVHGIEVVYEDSVLEVTLPGPLPKRKQRQNTEFLLDPFYFSLEQYAKEHPMAPLQRLCGVLYAGL